jgi:hypothetical protein
LPFLSKWLENKKSVFQPLFQLLSSRPIHRVSLARFHSSLSRNTPCKSAIAKEARTDGNTCQYDRGAIWDILALGHARWNVSWCRSAGLSPPYSCLGSSGVPLRRCGDINSDKQIPPRASPSFGMT